MKTCLTSWSRDPEHFSPALPHRKRVGDENQRNTGSRTAPSRGHRVLSKVDNPGAAPGQRASVAAGSTFQLNRFAFHLVNSTREAAGFFYKVGTPPAYMEHPRGDSVIQQEGIAQPLHSSSAQYQGTHSGPAAAQRHSYMYISLGNDAKNTTHVHASSSKPHNTWGLPLP